MEALDWSILIGTLAFIVGFGIWKTKGSKNVTDYVLAGKESNWTTVGLSVMATQASAITFLSTPGQAFHDGMGFVQFYFGMPLAMIIICIVFIPIYHKLKVYTAYEFLENRFDVKTRTLAAILFLIQRGLQAGITIFAPSIILSAVLGWDLRTLNILIGSIVTIYTVSGGTKAVNVTQKQQMFIIMIGMFVAFFFILGYLPADITFSKALKIAGASGKLDILDFSFSTSSRYTFWNGITGGLFLSLAYFGTDQSQVQRYLSGKSIRESQLGLIFNGILKIPMQFFILLVGVLVFVFYQYNPSPLNFNPAATAAVLDSKYADDYKLLETAHEELAIEKKIAQDKYSSALDIKEYDATVEAKQHIVSINQKDIKNRQAARAIIKEANSTVETNDKDYVFIHFILNYLPKGLIGLLLAVILSAAMSSTASELNALGTITALDIFKRHTENNTKKTQEYYVSISKWFTLLWGIIAILGIFLLAFFFKFVKGNAVFIGAILTQFLIFVIYYSLIYIYPTGQEKISYLLLNLFGCGIVIIISCLLQLFDNLLKKPPIKV